MYFMCYHYISLFPGTTVRIGEPQNGFFIIPDDGTNCMHPWDHIYMPWGYSPWISGAITPQFMPLISTLVTLLSISYSILQRYIT